jgi:beta-glucoside operon transcriptional antiterminator
MLALKKINNNFVLCQDEAGEEIVAMGKGLGFGELPREISIKEVERTFYDVDERYLSSVQSIPQDVMSLAVKICDIARKTLPYQVSPNLTFTMADHIEFILERARKGINVKMPLAYDVEQCYPAELDIGKYAVRRIRKDLKVNILASEATGIALNIVSARVDDTAGVGSAGAGADEDMLEELTEIIEDEMGTIITRDSFAFSRYATHMNYLFQRLHANEELGMGYSKAFEDLSKDCPEASRCVEKMSGHILEKWGSSLSDEEKLYLILHVSRLCIKEE